MPKLAIPLTDIRIKAAKPKEKLYQLADGGGMYLEVMTSGSKIWRMAYRQPNRKVSTRLTFGHYPAVTLADTDFNGFHGVDLIENVLMVNQCVHILFRISFVNKGAIS